VKRLALTRLPRIQHFRRVVVSTIRKRASPRIVRWLFTTIATLGTPQNVTLQELRIESFFTLNDDSAAILCAWAAG
jgi:hypothetical protein